MFVVVYPMFRFKIEIEQLAGRSDLVLSKADTFFFFAVDTGI